MSEAHYEQADTETVAFDTLRTDTIAQMGVDLAARLATNLIPTPEEISLGTYVEALEPQVREAVLRMREKGYATKASGFHGSDDDWRVLGIDNPARTYDPSNRRAQVINFEPVEVDNETRARLGELGAEALEWPGEEGKLVVIGFVPDTPDLAAIRGTWNAIAEVLPDRGAPASPNGRFGIYCPPDAAWSADAGRFYATMEAAGVVPGPVAPTSMDMSSGGSQQSPL